MTTSTSSTLAPRKERAREHLNPARLEWLRHFQPMHRFATGRPRLARLPFRSRGLSQPGACRSIRAWSLARCSFGKVM